MPWVTSWWEVYRPRLRLATFVVRRGNNLVAICPSAIRKADCGLDEVVFLGTGLSDQLDWLLKPHHDPVAVAEALILGLDAAGLTNLDLIDLPSDSLLLDAIRRHRLLTAAAISTAEARLMVSLQTTWPEYLASRSRNMRQTLNRVAARARDKQVGPLVRLTRPADCAAVLPDFFRLHLAWWSERRRTSILADQDVQRFLALALPRLAHAGQAEVTVRRAGADLVSAFILLRWQGVTAYYQSALNPDDVAVSPGLAHMAATLEAETRGRGSTFDLLRGDEPYKRRFATDQTETWRVRGPLH